MMKVNIIGSGIAGLSGVSSESRCTYMKKERWILRLKPTRDCIVKEGTLFSIMVSCGDFRYKLERNFFRVLRIG